MALQKDSKQVKLLNPDRSLDLSEAPVMALQAQQENFRRIFTMACIKTMAELNGLLIHTLI